MYKNVIDPGKSVSFVMKDIDIGGQNQYAMCTGPFFLEMKIIYICNFLTINFYENFHEYFFVKSQ